MAGELQHREEPTAGRYRGPDRRASMDGVPEFRLALPCAAVVLAGIVGAVLLRAAPSLDSELATVSTVGRIALAVAGIAAMLRWRLDHLSRSYWFGLAALVAALPLLTISAGTRSTDAMTFAVYVATIPLVWFGNRSPAVDTARRLRRSVAWIVPLVAAALVLGAIERPGFHTAMLVCTSVLLFGLLAQWILRARGSGALNGRWYVPTLLATSLAPLAGIAAGSNSLEYPAGGPMLLVAAGVAFTGSIAELHLAAARHQGLVLAATIARDDEVDRRTRQEAEAASQLHEVRSRVAAIEGGVSVMRGVDARDDLSAAVGAEIERLRKLVAPAPRDEAGPFNVLDALRPTLVVAATSWPVDYAIPEDLMAVGRGDDLAQVVHGLIHNASKFATGSPIEVTATVDGGHVLVSVDDHGAGVPRGERELIFERGWRGSRDGDGFGLGLSIARELMTASDGDLWVAPRPGGGARFTASLPAWTGLSSVESPGITGAAEPSPELSDEDRALARRRLGGSEGIR